MIIGKDKMIFRRLNSCVDILFLASCILLLASVTACGRRGDPVLPPSYDERVIKEDKGEIKEGAKEAGEPLIKEGPAGTEGPDEPLIKEEPETARPDAPVDLAAVYTGKGIVLVWKEVLKQGVTSYRIYRSAGEGFAMAGETVGPAFTDRDIVKHKKYYYKVTAVGRSESLPSTEIIVETENE